jgi:hypothetical protein
MNIQDIQLDLDKSPSVWKWVTIGQGDKAGTTIRATVYDNGAAAALAGMSARFEMRMPNATYFEDTNCTVSGNVITYVVDESHAALYAGGGSEAYFALYDGDTAIYSTERFHVRVARAASDGANPGRAWTNGIEEWLEDASDELDGYVASADARVGATINAANAAVEGMRSDVDGAIEDTEDVIGRAESAIDAMGDISELAVPLMSSDVRGGAKLGTGLRLDDGHLSVEPISVASVHAITGIGA